MIENVDLTLVDWSRAQFALTAVYHWLFVPLTLGLSFIIAIMETIYVKTGMEAMEAHYTLLDDSFRDQFCHWRCYRHYP